VALGATAFGEGFDPITYFAPSMAILFAFLTLGAGARTVIVERREGTLARIRSTPISDRAVLVGVTASVVLVGLVSFLVIWLVTSVVFGADWGDPAGVLLVIVATVLAIAGISTLVTGLARTEAQADGITSVLAFGFVLIGGGFLSPGDLPDALARVALITPNRWALDAFAELAAGASGIPAVLTPGPGPHRHRSGHRCHRSAPRRSRGAMSDRSPTSAPPRTQCAVIAVARTELTRILRDRTGLFFIVVLPLLVIVVIGASIGSVAGAARIGVLDLDRTPASARLIAELDASERLDVVTVSEREALAVDVRLDRLRAG
jgi:ABC-type Na+ efflux pump permease subunit